MNNLYLQVHQALVKNGASTQMLADVDAIFLTPATTEAAAAPAALSLPPNAKPNAVVFDTTGKSYADFKAFFDKVGFVPIYDQNGNELDVRGQPITPDGAPVNTDIFRGAVWALLQTPESTVTLNGTCPEDGNYQVEVGEQYDQVMALTQNGEVATTRPWTKVALKAGATSIATSFNPKAVSDDVLQKRIAQGQGVSGAHYYLRRM